MARQEYDFKDWCEKWMQERLLYPVEIRVVDDEPIIEDTQFIAIVKPTRDPDWANNYFIPLVLFDQYPNLELANQINNIIEDVMHETNREFQESLTYFIQATIWWRDLKLIQNIEHFASILTPLMWRKENFRALTSNRYKWGNDPAPPLNFDNYFIEEIWPGLKNDFQNFENKLYSNITDLDYFRIPPVKAADIQYYSEQPQSQDDSTTPIQTLQETLKKKLTQRDVIKSKIQGLAKEHWKHQQISGKPLTPIHILCMDKTFKKIAKNNRPLKKEPYSDRTIHKWISKFAPPELRKPGRRPIKKD